MYRANYLDQLRFSVRVEKTVFISYRRANASWALAFYHKLTQHGYDVFFDYKGLSSGSFEQGILENIRSRAHFLVILAPSALDRCDESGDWFRREIEEAIECGRNIVPLMLESFEFGAPSVSEKLTGKLATLKEYNGLGVSVEYFDATMIKLQEQFLDVSLNAVLQPASETARDTVIAQQAAANAAPEVSITELTAKDQLPDSLPDEKRPQIEEGEIEQPKALERESQVPASDVERLETKFANDLAQHPGSIEALISLEQVGEVPPSVTPRLTIVQRLRRNSVWLGTAVGTIAAVVALLPVLSDPPPVNRGDNAHLEAPELQFPSPGIVKLLQNSVYAKLELELGLSLEERRHVQQALNAKGQYVGPPDGIFGPKTRTGIRNWRKENGFEANEYLDDGSYKMLLASLPATPLPATPLPVQTRWVEPDMVRIPQGTFMMGSESNDLRGFEEPVHEVSVPAFDLARNELTWEEWQLCEEAGRCTKIERPTFFNEIDTSEQPRHPVVNVDIENVNEYLTWISEKTGHTYRLPSEAEWEYAARAGTHTDYHWGDIIGENNANCGKCGSQWDYQSTAPVGSFDDNPFGLNDAHGNVSEWIADCWHINYTGAPDDGSPWVENCVDDDDELRLLRGGEWNSQPTELHVTSRTSFFAFSALDFVGFRLARSLP